MKPLERLTFEGRKDWDKTNKKQFKGKSELEKDVAHQSQIMGDFFRGTPHFDAMKKMTHSERVDYFNNNYDDILAERESKNKKTAIETVIDSTYNKKPNETVGNYDITSVEVPQLNSEITSSNIAEPVESKPLFDVTKPIDIETYYDPTANNSEDRSIKEYIPEHTTSEISTDEEVFQKAGAYGRAKENYTWVSQKQRQDVEKMAVKYSKNYRNYKHLDWATLEDNEWESLTKEFMALNDAYGEEKAGSWLSRQVDDLVAEKQTYASLLYSGVSGLGCSTVGTLAQYAGIANGAYNIISGNYEFIDDVNWLTNAIHAANTSKAATWGRDVMKYGTLRNEKMEFAKRNDYDYLPILMTYEDQMSENGTFFSQVINKRTLPELLKSQGFTVGMMLFSLGSSSLLNAVHTGMSKVATTTAAKVGGKFSAEIGAKAANITAQTMNAMNKTALLSVPLVGSMSESMINSFDAYEQVLNQNRKAMEDMYDAEMAVRFNQMLGDSDSLQEALDNLSDKRTSSSPEGEFRQQYKAEELMDMPEEMRNSLLMELYADFYNNNLDTYERHMKELEIQAMKAEGTNYLINQAINGVIAYSGKAILQSPSVKNTMNNSYLGKSINNTFNKKGTINGGNGTPYTVNANTPGNFRLGWAGLKAPIAEGIEESLQYTGEKIATTQAEYNLAGYMHAHLSGESNIEIGQYYKGVIGASALAGMNSFGDAEFYKAGIHGFLGTLLGNINTGMHAHRHTNDDGSVTVSRLGKSEHESTLEYINRVSPITNPSLMSYAKTKKEGRDAVEFAQFLEKYMNEPENAELFKGAMSLSTWNRQMSEAAAFEDEFSFRNSQMARTITHLNVLEKMKTFKNGSQYSKDYFALQEQLANMDVNSDEAQSFVQQLMENQEEATHYQDMTSVDIAESIVSNAKKMIELQGKMASFSKSVKRANPKLSDNAVETAVYGKLLSENLADRKKKIEEELSKVYDTSDSKGVDNKVVTKILNTINDEEATSIKDNADAQITKFNQDLQVLEREATNINKLINDTKKKAKNKDYKGSGGYTTKEGIRAGKAALRENQKKIKDLKTNIKYAEKTKAEVDKRVQNREKLINENNGVFPTLSASDIMSLETNQRAAMLYDENFIKSLPKEQQEVITKLKEDLLIADDGIENKIKDHARIQNTSDNIKKEYSDLLKGSKYIKQFEYKTMKAADDILIGAHYNSLKASKDLNSFMTILNVIKNTNQHHFNTVYQRLLAENDQMILELQKMIERYNEYAKLNIDDRIKKPALACINYALDNGIDIRESSKVLNFLSELDSIIDSVSDFLEENKENATQAKLAESNTKNLEYVISLFKAYNEEEEARGNAVTPIEFTLVTPYVETVDTQTTDPVVSVENITTDEEEISDFIMSLSKKLGDRINISENIFDKLSKLLEEHYSKEDLYNHIEVLNTLVTKINTKEDLQKYFDELNGILNPSPWLLNKIKEEQKAIMDVTPETKADLSEIIENTEKEMEDSEKENTGTPLSEIIDSANKENLDRNKANGKIDKVTNTSVIVNSTRISTLSLDLNHSGIQKVFKKYGIEEFLTKFLVGETYKKYPILFLSSRDLAVDMGNDNVAMNRTNLPVLAVVEVNAHTDTTVDITEDDGSGNMVTKYYQPVGYMPSNNSEYSNGSGKMASIRNNITDTSKNTIIENNGKPITSRMLKIHTNTPKQVNKGKENSYVSLDEIAKPKSKIELLKLQINSSKKIKELGAKFTNLKNNIKYVQDSLRSKLVYEFVDSKGAVHQALLTVQPVHDTYNLSEESFLDVISKASEGNTDGDLTHFNYFMNMYHTTLTNLYKSNIIPIFNDIIIDDDESIENTSEIGAMKRALDDGLKLLSRYVKLQGNYNYNTAITFDNNDVQVKIQVLNEDGDAISELVFDSNTTTVTEQNLANFLKPLLLNSDGSINLLPGGNTGMIWQIDFGNFGKKESNSNYINNVLTSNVIMHSKDKVNTSILGASLDNPFDINGGQVEFKNQEEETYEELVEAANSNNANTNATVTGNNAITTSGAVVDTETSAPITPITPTKPVVNNPVTATTVVRTSMTSEAIKQILKTIKEFSQKLIQDRENNTFTNGKKNYVGVTRLLASSYESGNLADLPLGNAMDELIRDFFDPSITFDKKSKAYEILGDNIDLLVQDLENYKKKQDELGWTIVSKDVATSSVLTLNLDDGTTKDVNVLGVLDLLAYNSKGEFKVVDVKTFRSDSNTTLDKHSPESLESYTKQVSLYAKSLEQQYGLNVVELEILPVKLNYGDNSLFEINPDDELTYRGSKFTLDYNSAIVQTPITVQPVEVTVSSNNQYIQDAVLPSNTTENVNTDTETTTSESAVVENNTEVQTESKEIPVEVQKTEITNLTSYTATSEELNKKSGRSTNRGRRSTTKVNPLAGVSLSEVNKLSYPYDKLTEKEKAAITQEEWDKSSAASRQRLLECV